MVSSWQRAPRPERWWSALFGAAERPAVGRQIDKGPTVENRCWGVRPRYLQRCGRIGDWRFFYGEHKRQPIIWVVSLLAILGAYASIHTAWFATDPSEVRTTEQTASAVLFPEGWSSLDYFDLNRSSALPVQVGHCPGTACFRFTLGTVVDREGEFRQIVYLDGGGFVERIEQALLTGRFIQPWHEP